MEGDAFSNRDTESRSGFMSSVGGQTPAGASSPPYRPLDDVPCDTENVPRLLDIKSLQSILAAQVALQAERQERRAATVSDETALTVALSPSSQLRQGELLGFRASIASPNSRYVRELDMSTESGGTSTPGGKGQFVEGSPLKGNQTPDGASSGIPHNSPEKEANESPALVSLILSDDGKVTALPDASASWIGSGGRAAGGEGDNVSTSDWLSSSLPADNLEAPSWRVDPAAVHPTVVLKRSYAWNPWTKTYVPLEQPLRVKHLWCWQLGNINWWTGFLFLIGSVGFFAGAMTGSLRTSHTPEHLPVKIWGELMPYLVGGICFVAGAATFSISSMQQIDRDNKRDNPAYESLLNSREYGFDVTATPAPGAVTWLGVWEVRCLGTPQQTASRYLIAASLIACSLCQCFVPCCVQVAPAPGEGPLNRPVTLPRRESSGCKQRQRAAAEEEFQRLWREYDPWTRRQHVVEFWGGVAVFLGTLFYKVCALGLFTPEPACSTAPFLGRQFQANTHPVFKLILPNFQLLLPLCIRLS